jgi:hypothetical protein
MKHIMRRNVEGQMMLDGNNLKKESRKDMKENECECVCMKVKV